MTVRILALVGDAFGGRGGIARYNRDLFTALAAAGGEIVVLPRLGDAAGVALPAGVRQRPAIFGKLSFSLASLWTAWRLRPVDVVFCGHVFMAPLAVLLADTVRQRDARRIAKPRQDEDLRTGRGERGEQVAVVARDAAARAEGVADQSQDADGHLASGHHRRRPVVPPYP